MTSSKHVTVDNTAVFRCPCLPVWGHSTWILQCHCIRTRWGQFPAVSKLKGINHNLFAPCGEIILDIPIVIPTETTDFALESQGVTCKTEPRWQLLYFSLKSVTNLECRTKPNHQCCLPVPDQNKTVLSLNDKIYTHSVDVKGDVYSCALIYNFDIFVWKNDFTVLKDTRC